MFSLRTSHRLLITIFITQSLFSASQISIITLHSIAAGILGGGDSTAGMPTTIVTFSHSLIAYAFGIYMGHFGRRMGLSTAYAFGAIGGVLGTLAVLHGHFLLLLVSAAFMGFASAGSQLSRFVVGEMFPAEKRAQMIGRVVFAGTIGAIFGPALIEPGTQLAGLLSLDLATGLPLADSGFLRAFMPRGEFVQQLTTGPWVMASFMYGLSFIICMIFLRPEPALVARQYIGHAKSGLGEDAEHRLLDLLRLPNVQLAILSMLICQTVMSSLMTITPWHMHRADHANATVSLVISAHVLGMFGLSAITGYLIDRYGRVPMMVVAALLLIASAIISPLSTQLPYLLVGLFLLGLGWNFGYIAGSSMLADALSGSDRTRVAGFNDMLVAFCAGLGTLSSGFLYGLGGFLLVSIGGGVLALLLLALVRQLSQHKLVIQAS